MLASVQEPCCEWTSAVLAAVGFESLGELGSAAALNARSGPRNASKSSKCNGGFIIDNVCTEAVVINVLLARGLSLVLWTPLSPPSGFFLSPSCF